MSHAQTILANVKLPQFLRIRPESPDKCEAPLVSPYPTHPGAYPHAKLIRRPRMWRERDNLVPRVCFGERRTGMQEVSPNGHSTDLMVCSINSVDKREHEGKISLRSLCSAQTQQTGIVVK